jgi:predicted RNA-binding Zn-ribbon protein involved in translation (DUF1610 family)
MPAIESLSDPLKELGNLTSELADLERQLADRKISAQEFEDLSQQLRERILTAESQAYTIARKDANVAKKLRVRDYNDPAVQQVCSHFVYGTKRPLEPDLGVDRVPKYSVEPEEGQRVAVDRALLQRMADTGILNETLFEKILLCPRCASPSDVFARFKCPQCGSIDISINRMMEHIQCGTIHQESAFRVGKAMACPACKKPIQKPEESRLIGLVCSCKACGAHFEDPAQSNHCRRCKIEFGLSTAIVSDVQTYNINDALLEEVRSQLGIPALVRALTVAGFEATGPGFLAAGSKQVEFSVVARKNANVVAIDISQSDSEVGVEPVLALYAKLLEATPNLAVLGAIPGLSNKAQNVASSHNILVAVGTSPAEVARQILEITKGM